MNKEVITKIIYLTHDKWGTKLVKKNYRDEFEQFLIYFLKECPEGEKTLDMILEYANKDDKLLIMKGVFNILQAQHPTEYKFVSTRTKVKQMKKELNL